VGLYTRADGPPSPAVKVATQIIVAIARRLATSDELRNSEQIARSFSIGQSRVAAKI
jgi:hypothetical protein